LTSAQVSHILSLVGSFHNPHNSTQALFIRLGLNTPFPNPILVKVPTADPPAILIYSASTTIGLFAIELVRITRTPSGKPYRIFVTANPKHHAKLLASGVEAAFDYRSKTWIEEVRKASGGISVAYDCISEQESTAQISQTFVESGGTIAVVRKASWNKDGIKEGVTPIYSAVWSGLGHELVYNGT
jgi:NADPH:quinone reductase-like Zn-dependent oxidoreductase